MPPRPVFYCCVGAFLVFLIYSCWGGATITMGRPAGMEWVQQGRQIGQCMFSYATDNVNGEYAYPDGKSSTEVFQKLMDQNYCSDPTLFYFPMPGKVAPKHDQKILKPENVSWDVTAPVDSASPDTVPLLFLTGYKVQYEPSGSAVPRNGRPMYGLIQPQPWWARWLNWPPQYIYNPAEGIAVFYKGNNAAFIKTTVEPDGTIRNFIPPSFKPDGKTYRQLTPDGVMR